MARYRNPPIPPFSPYSPPYLPPRSEIRGYDPDIGRKDKMLGRRISESDLDFPQAYESRAMQELLGESPNTPIMSYVDRLLALDRILPPNTSPAPPEVFWDPSRGRYIVNTSFDEDERLRMPPSVVSELDPMRRQPAGNYNVSLQQPDLYDMLVMMGVITPR